MQRETTILHRCIKKYRCVRVQTLKWSQMRLLDWFSVSQESKCSEFWAGPEGSAPGELSVSESCAGGSCSPQDFHSVISRVPQLPATGANFGCRKEFHPGLTSPSPLLKAGMKGEVVSSAELWKAGRNYASATPSELCECSGVFMHCFKRIFVPCGRLVISSFLLMRIRGKRPA